MLAIPYGRRLTLLVHSLGLAAGVAAGGVILGILAGSVLWRWHSGPGLYLRWFILALVPVPPYVHALAWSSFAFAANSWFQKWGLPGIPFRGWFGSWWIQWMALVPIAIGLTLIGLESVDPDLIDAARLLRSDIHSLRTIVLPLAGPAILAGGGFLFILSLVDYSIPSLFHVNVYALEIFAEYSASNQPARAFLLALPLLLLATGVVLFSQSPLRNAALSPPWRRRTWAVAPAWPAWLVWLQRVAFAILIVQILVPLVNLILSAGSWQNIVLTAVSAQREIAFTSWIAALTAIACLPLGLPVAYELVQPTKRGRLWWAIVTTPLAIPAPLIGIGLIAIWNRPIVPAVYGSSLMPVLAALARFTPLACIVLLAQLRRIDPALIDAARILQTSAAQTWVQIRLPLLAPGLLAAASIASVLSASELGATLIVAPPGQATLTMRIYNFLHYGASDTVAGLCLMMTVAALFSGILAMLVLAGWSRFQCTAMTQ
jgi:iron(III) transport system permease protein